MTEQRRVPGDVLVHLRCARDHLDRNFAEPFDLDHLAGLAGMSRFHFLRSLSITYRTTPAAYLAERRVERAQDEGGLPGIGLNVDDCRATYKALRAKGVEFLQEPEERPYGVEALMRDNSGNWMVLVEKRDYSPEDFEGVDMG